MLLARRVRLRRFLVYKATLTYRRGIEWYEDCADVAIRGTGTSLTGPQLVRYNTGTGLNIDSNVIGTANCCLAYRTPGPLITVTGGGSVASGGTGGTGTVAGGSSSSSSGSGSKSGKRKVKKKVKRAA